MKYANFSGVVTMGNGRQLSMREGDLYADDDALVADKPELFTDTEPNSQVAGAFPMEGTLRNSDLTHGDVVEELRWEGHHPPGYERSDEPKSPTMATELRQEGEPEREEDSDSSGDEKSERTAGETPARKRAAAPRVERATRAPGEKR